VLFVELLELDLSVELLVESDFSLLFALFEMVERGVDFLKRKSRSGLECWSLVVRQSHGEVVVDTLQ